jgi:uncharacterized protein
MLIQFTVGNFKSFKEKATLSLEATTDDWLEGSNVAIMGEQRLVKSAAVFGANASGKSGFLQAMALFRDLVEKSSKDAQTGERIPVIPFRLHTDTEFAPTFFEIVFVDKEVRYRYGFEATFDRVVSEWLFSQEDSIRETRFFTREAGQIEVSDSFKEGKGLEKRTRTNALFLSVVAQFNGEIAVGILNWMGRFRNVSTIEDADYMRYTANRLRESEYAALIHELTKKADIGIERLQRLDLQPEEAVRLIQAGTLHDVRQGLLSGDLSAFAIKTFHRKYGPGQEIVGPVEFDLKTDESAGTQRFVALTGPFLYTLRHGSTLFVDELEARLHPLLTKALVSLFNSPANTNNAQLIFATHDEGLLDPKRVRRDQVWFAEKDDFGASRLYSLAEFKVRKEAKFAKEYLLGQFGAVPRVGDFEEILINGRG